MHWDIEYTLYRNEHSGLKSKTMCHALFQNQYPSSLLHFPKLFFSPFTYSSFHFFVSCKRKMRGFDTQKDWRLQKQKPTKTQTVASSLLPQQMLGKWVVRGGVECSSGLCVFACHTVAYSLASLHVSQYVLLCSPNQVRTIQHDLFALFSSQSQQADRSFHWT